MGDPDLGRPHRLGLARSDLSFQGLFGPMLGLLLWSKLTLIFVLAIAYLVGVMLAVQEVIPLHASSLKAAVLWFGTGLVAVGRVLASRPERPSFRRILAGAVTITIAIEFLVNLYAFSFALELVLIPLVSLIAPLRVVSADKEEYAPVDKLLGRLQMTIGIGLIVFALWHVVGDPGSFFSRENAEYFIVAPALTVLFLPLLYSVALLSAYEQLLLRVEFAIEDPAVARRAKLIALIAGRLNLARADELVAIVAGRWNIESLDEFKTVIARRSHSGAQQAADQSAAATSS